MMPKLTGIEIARRLGASCTGTQHIPVILVSAGLPDGLVGGGLPAGVDAFISKPFTAKDIASLVQKLLRRPGAVAG